MIISSITNFLDELLHELLNALRLKKHYENLKVG